ncbi:hypothetical protein SANTM175S_08438 [Streptomyces antimycoticus]
MTTASTPSPPGGTGGRVVSATATRPSADPATDPVATGTAAAEPRPSPLSSAVRSPAARKLAALVVIAAVARPPRPRHVGERHLAARADRRRLRAARRRHRLDRLQPRQPPALPLLLRPRQQRHHPLRPRRLPGPPRPRLGRRHRRAAPDRLAGRRHPARGHDPGLVRHLRPARHLGADDADPRADDRRRHASVVVGGLLGLAGGLSEWAFRVLRPVLDTMQVLPAFAYLLPVVMIFGNGVPGAVLATVIYAAPPWPGSPPSACAARTPGCWKR